MCACRIYCVTTLAFFRQHNPRTRDAIQALVSLCEGGDTLCCHLPWPLHRDVVALEHSDSEAVNCSLSLSSPRFVRRSRVWKPLSRSLPLSLSPSISHSPVCHTQVPTAVLLSAATREFHTFRGLLSPYLILLHFRLSSLVSL